jgi:hypothetical protein
MDRAEREAKERQLMLYRDALERELGIYEAAYIAGEIILSADYFQEIRALRDGPLEPHVKHLAEVVQTLRLEYPRYRPK